MNITKRPTGWVPDTSQADDRDGDGAARPGDAEATTLRGRRDRIAERVLREPFVSVKDLARAFGVSVMTVHRDLDDLESQGVLRKVRGGATPEPSSLFESNARYRVGVARAEKEALARFAVGQVEPGQAVMLDDSTTVLTLARLLPTVVPLTVLTNSLAVLQELSPAADLRMIVLGGDYLGRHNCFSGLVCEATIAALRADVLFMSSMAVSAEAVFQPDPELVLVKRAMIAAAARRILLVDHSKFGQVALHRVAALRDFDLVVVDDGIDEAGLSQLRAAGAPFAVAPVARPDGPEDGSRPSAGRAPLGRR